MKRHEIKQAAKDGVVIGLRAIAALAAVMADGSFWLYDRAQTRLAAPQPPKRVQIPVKRLGLETGQFVPIRRPARVTITVQHRVDRGRRLKVRLPRKIKVKYAGK